MKRADAEQLALSYCRRNVATAARWGDRSRAAAEREVVNEARQLYGSGLTKAAVRRIRQRLRADRERAKT
jgi:hypothetical protein